MDTIRPKKSLGQHFLKDLSIAQKIVETTRNFPELPVLEIGPGMGVLTQLLLQQNRDITVVEIDKQSVSYLQRHYPNLCNRIIEADFLQLNLDDLFSRDFCIIGNYPYHISSQILFKVLNYKNKIPFCSGILQKETVQRLVALPGSKAYGITTVFIQTWYDVEYLFTISPNCFYPPPKVQSSIFRMIRNQRTELKCNEFLFKTIVKKSFNQRRKTLKNSLKPLLRKNYSLSSHSIFDKRPEQLSIEEFVRLTNLFSEY